VRTPPPDRHKIGRELALEARDAIVSVLYAQASQAAVYGRIAARLGIPVEAIEGIDDESMEALVTAGTRRRRRFLGRHW
jgi:hypothetical protein